MGTQMAGDVGAQVENYVSNLKKMGYLVRSAVIFGSRVRGDNLKSSDIDLLLVVENPEKNFVERTQRFSALWGYETPLEVFVYTPKEVLDMFMRGSITLYDALHQGIVIRDSNFIAPLRYAFKRALAEKILSKSPRGWWKLPEDQNLLKRHLDQALID